MSQSPRRPSTRRRASRARGAARWGPVLLLLLGFVLSGTIGAGAYFLPLVTTAARQTNLPSGRATTEPAPAPPTAPFTVLLLGSDDDSKFAKDRVLTQTMILIRVNPEVRQVTMLSIPRDLWVPLSTGGSAKIDLAYERGGARAAIATVERNFKVHVDEYAWVGLKGLIHLIDRVGGVDLVTTNPVLDDFYPADLTGGSPYGYMRIAVLPGPQHLDGTHALEYVRSRHGDLRGDFGRSQRQQQLLLAIKGRTGGLGLADLPDLASTVSGEFMTSMSLDRLRQLLPVARQFDSGNVHQVLLLPPYTSSAVIEGQDALLPHWNLIIPLVHQSFP